MGGKLLRLAWGAHRNQGRGEHYAQQPSAGSGQRPMGGQSEQVNSGRVAPPGITGDMLAEIYGCTYTCQWAVEWWSCNVWFNYALEVLNCVQPCASGPRFREGFIQTLRLWQRSIFIPSSDSTLILPLPLAMQVCRKRHKFNFIFPRNNMT